MRIAGRVALLVLLSLSAQWGSTTVSSAAEGGKASHWVGQGEGHLSKVAGGLLRARWEAQQERLAPTPGPFERQALRSVDGEPEVEVRLHRLTPEILERLRAIGMQVQHYSFRWARVSGTLDLDLLDEVAALAEVSTIHPNYGRTTWTGSVTSQGDASMRAPAARSTFGATGSGVQVGVMSDSFNDIITGSVSGTGCNRILQNSSPQLTGDLPPTVVLLDNGPGGGSDEGAALGEIVADVAPGADILSHSAFNSPTDFAEGIIELKDCGADVIVDDVLWFAEPRFQDGPIAQAAQEVSDAGVFYFSSAGNSATYGIEDSFVDSNPTDDTNFPPSGNDFHDFGGTRFAPFTVPGGGCTIFFVLQWSEPFSGTLGPGASSDLDLWFCTDQDPSSCVPDLSGLTLQGCGAGPSPQGDPIELVGLTTLSAAPASGYLAIDNYCGSENLDFSVKTIGLCGLPGDHSFGPMFGDNQVYGHAACRDCTAVGASFYGEIDSDGALDPPPGQLDVEVFSSLGGDVGIYFDPSGNPVNPPEMRFKPEITSVDGGNNTFFGSDIGFDPDDDPNFFGTSASAPHAAGLMALLVEGTNLAIHGVRQILAQTAVDMETPGRDPLSGDGFIDAMRTFGTVAPGDHPCQVPHLEISAVAMYTNTVVHAPFNDGPQWVRACDSITFGEGFFSDITAEAASHIFADGFESGDTSAWSH